MTRVMEQVTSRLGFPAAPRRRGPVPRARGSALADSLTTAIGGTHADNNPTGSGVHLTSTPDGTRTRTRALLRRLPLPLGYGGQARWGQAHQASAPREPTTTEVPISALPADGQRTVGERRRQRADG